MPTVLSELSARPQRMTKEERKAHFREYPDLEAFAGYIKPNETAKPYGDLSVYTDTAGHKTIGVGHKLVKGEDYKTITPEKSMELFKEDVVKKVMTAFDLFPHFDSYPTEVKSAILDGIFRGEFKKRHKTVKHINKGEWDKVPAEYIDRGDYRKSKKNKTGVYKRMDRNAGVYREFADKMANRPIK